jgi:hypothetical protein
LYCAFKRNGKVSVTGLTTGPGDHKNDLILF